eukprot:TRINITY_DN6482_c0_g1_i1.p5 TRINITY_DN6482_c0_g1~~TRINITY_DN6482_c0_g1_i1.p5  ORF type:complete len:125 (-),score=16.16 TRINITY_DN6482_c0_g1_i1:76-450(-)
MLPDHTNKAFIYIFFIFYGISGSLFTASSGPYTKLLIFKDLTTTAYGLGYSAMNLMLFVGPAVVGSIIDRTVSVSGGYFWSSVFFCAMSIVAAVLGFIILIWDYKGNQALYRGVAVINESDYQQ